MKKTFLYILLSLCINLVYSQKSNQLIEILGQEFTTNNYFEITAQLDSFWESQPNKYNKGSGFKVYQRWKEHWKYYLNADGTLTQKSKNQENKWVYDKDKIEFVDAKKKR